VRDVGAAFRAAQQARRDQLAAEQRQFIALVVAVSKLPIDLSVRVLQFVDDYAYLVALSSGRCPLRAACRDPRMWRVFRYGEHHIEPLLSIVPWSRVQHVVFCHEDYYGIPDFKPRGRMAPEATYSFEGRWTMTEDDLDTVEKVYNCAKIEHLVIETSTFAEARDADWPGIARTSRDVTVLVESYYERTDVMEMYDNDNFSDVERFIKHLRATLGVQATVRVILRWWNGARGHMDEDELEFS
jgi:hypothetical protein